MPLTLFGQCEVGKVCLAHLFFYSVHMHVITYFHNFLNFFFYINIIYT